MRLPSIRHDGGFSLAGPALLLLLASFALPAEGYNFLVFHAPYPMSHAKVLHIVTKKEHLLIALIASISNFTTFFF